MRQCFNLTIIINNLLIANNLKASLQNVMLPKNSTVINKSGIRKLQKTCSQLSYQTKYNSGLFFYGLEKIPLPLCYEQTLKK
jgi:hypothetical protein